jgi:hypothetical protein
MPTVSAAPTTRSTASRSNAVPSPPPLPSLINRQPSKERGRHRIRHIAANSSGRRRVHYRSCREAVIADDPPALGDDIRPRCAARFVLPSPALQPVIERRRT